MLKKLLTILLVSGCASLCAADSSEQFLSAYQAYQQAEKAERDGNNTVALRRYRFAESILVEITAKDPAWNKPVIEYRLKKTRDGLERLEGAGADDTTPRPSPSPDPLPAEASPQLPSITVTPPASGAASSSPKQRQGSESSSEVRRLKKQLDALKGELQEAREALTSEKSRTKDLDNAKWVEERTALEKDLLNAKDQVATLGERLRKRDSWEKDIKELQRRLDDAVADKAATEELYQQHEKKTEEVAAEMARQLQDARLKLSSADEVRQKYEQLAKDVAKGGEVIADLKAKQEHSEQLAREGSARIEALQKQLASATEQLADARKRADELGPLRDKLKDLQQQSERFQNEAKGAGGKIAALEKTLQKSRSDSDARESSLRADLQVLEEERQRIAVQASKLADAAKQAAKVQGLEDGSNALKSTVVQLQDRLERADRELSKVRKDAESSANAAKAAADRIAAITSSSQADTAVLEEERDRLTARLEETCRKVADLGKQASAVQPLNSEIESLKGRLAENEKALGDVKEKLAAAEKTESADAQRISPAAVDALRQMLGQQNASMKEQLKSALDRLEGLVEHAPDSSALQDQVRKIQEQITLSSRSYADAQRQIDEISKARPEQEKALKEKEKALADSKKEAESLRSDLSVANGRVAALQQQNSEGENRFKKLQEQLAVMSKGRPADIKGADDDIKQVEKLRAELADAKQRINSLQGNEGAIRDLEQKLAERESELANLKKQEGKSSVTPDGKPSEENNLLRGIVLRQLKEEARRAQARRLMEDEIKRLNIRSDVLTEQITVLAAPAITLTPEERALFKDGQSVIVSEGEGKMQASVSAPLKAPDEGKFKECLARAKEEFDRQDYLQAENTFKQVLEYSPEDYFALSNLGVVEFQLGKLKEAEALLLKASQKSSDNSFAMTTLGIVLYRQERLGDAEKTLTKAISMNQQDFTAHNYLGIVLAASGKGKAGEGEIMKAIEINPQYADAHFNLAVIYATSKPPAKMLAKKHYAKALELGAPPDPSLEHLNQ